MAKKFLVNIDLGGNQLLNARVQNGTGAPTAYGKGQLWFDTINNQLNVYNGSTFQPLATGGTAVSSLNSFTGAVNIYGTANQISVSNSSGSIVLSIPGTASVSYASNSGNSDTTSQTDFSSLTIGGNNVATQNYVTGLGYVTSSGSVAYATNAGNANTVTNGIYTTDTGTVTSTMIANNTIVNGDISNTAAITPNKLSASAITIAGTSVGLGGTLASIGVQYLSASNVTIGSTAVGLGDTATTITGLTKVTSASLTVSDTGDSTSTSTGALVVSGGAGIAKNVYIGGNLDVSGSVYISGSAFTVNASNITLADSLIYLATSNPSNLVDIGILGHFNDGTYQHTGVVRDATDNTWKLFSGVTDETTTAVNFAQATYDYLRSGGLQIWSNATTQTASLNSAGSLYAQSGTFVGSVNLGNTVATGSVQFATTASNTSQTNFSALTVSGSTVATQAYVDANAARKQTYTITGDSASTSFVVNHTLNTRDVTVQVYQNTATPDTQYAEVEVDIVRTTASAVTISFASAPTSGDAYRVVIVG